MKVSGFTIIRNGVEYSYPFLEAIQSILPLCDEVIVNYGISDDSTLQQLQTLRSGKIKIIERQWDLSLREEGKLLAQETNAALDYCTGDWCFYIQADEVVHEQDYEAILGAMRRYHNDKSVEGLRFWYKHFYGNYDYLQDNFRSWYVQEVRIIKNNRSIRSWGDAMGFKHPDGTMIRSKHIDARIYHYGWVRPPQRMKTKKEHFEKLYHSDAELTAITIPENIYTHLGHLRRFTETHPAVMRERIQNCDWEFNPHIEQQLPRWLRLAILFSEPLTKRVRRLLSTLKR